MFNQNMPQLKCRKIYYSFYLLELIKHFAALSSIQEGVKYIESGYDHKKGSLHKYV